MSESLNLLFSDLTPNPSNDIHPAAPPLMSPLFPSYIPLSTGPPGTTPIVNITQTGIPVQISSATLLSIPKHPQPQQHPVVVGSNPLINLAQPSPIPQSPQFSQNFTKKRKIDLSEELGVVVVVPGTSMQNPIEIKNLANYASTAGGGGSILSAGPSVMPLIINAPLMPLVKETTTAPAFTRKRRYKINCVQKHLLSLKMQAIVNQYKMHLKGEAVEYLMLALQERVKQILESLIDISHERRESAKSHQNTKISSNPGLFIQQIKNREKEEREKYLKLDKEKGSLSGGGEMSQSSISSSSSVKVEVKEYLPIMSNSITKKDFMLFAASEIDLKTKDFYHLIKIGL
jgi:hypothetical protein